MKLLYPKRLHLELTSNCNYQCLTCIHGYRDFGNHLSQKVKNIIIGELIPHANFLELQGTGESLTSPDFVDFLNAAINHQCETTLITNGSLLNKELLLLIAKANCRLVLSLDSAVKTTYQRIRANGDLTRVTKNLSFWPFIKNNLPSTNSSNLSINMVLCSLNYQELIPMIDYAIDIGASSLFVSEIRPCMKNDEAWEKLNLEKIKKTSTFQKMIDTVIQYANDKRLPMSFNFRKMVASSNKRNLCIAPWEHLYIDSSGNISICCESPQCFGNLHDLDFQLIWNGESLNQFRQNMATAQYHFTCKTCCLNWGI